MAKVKKHLTREEEFEILKLVLDKFLWIGVFLLMLGIYSLLFANFDFVVSLVILGAGVVLMLLFARILIREYNFAKD